MQVTCPRCYCIFFFGGGGVLKYIRYSLYLEMYLTIHFTSCHAGAIKQKSLVSEVVLQQTVTVIPPDVPQFIQPIQLSAQIDATVSIL